jgi:hypothetical protein
MVWRSHMTVADGLSEDLDEVTPMSKREYRLCNFWNADSARYDSCVSWLVDASCFQRSIISYRIDGQRTDPNATNEK